MELNIKLVDYLKFNEPVDHTKLLLMGPDGLEPMEDMTKGELDEFIASLGENLFLQNKVYYPCDLILSTQNKVQPIIDHIISKMQAGDDVVVVSVASLKPFLPEEKKG